MKKELIEKAGFSPTYEKDRLEKLIELTVIEVFKIMADYKTSNICVSTTYDASIAGCVIEQSIQAIAKEFDIKKPHEIKYETIMGRKVQTN